ncbi:MAG: hypothetical protein ACJAQ1_001357, partial [Flavobacterium sp.]
KIKIFFWKKISLQIADLLKLEIYSFHKLNPNLIT